MATPSAPPPGIDPRYIQQMMAAEAQRRGMTIEQLQAFHRQQIEQEAAKVGMSPQAFVAMKQKEAVEQHQKQQQAQQQAAARGGQPGATPAQGQPQAVGAPGQPQPGQMQQQIPLNGSVQAKPEALAVAKFLRSQNLKTRTCIFNDQRKDMFKVKRALRALQSDTYKKARSKNALLPEVTNELQAKGALQLMPVNMLALRVSKSDPHEGHNHGPSKKKEKRIKGLWTVKIERQQDFEPLMHYVWLYEGSQWKTKLWAGLALIAVFAAVLFPLWPLFMRQGVWYLSVGALGLLGLFFAMSIFRLILFVVTLFAVPPGLWLFPNLFEDVGFFDSFKPAWGWQENKKQKSKKKAGTAGEGALASTDSAAEITSSAKPNGAAVSSAVEVTPSAGALGTTKRHEAPTVEEADDD